MYNLTKFSVKKHAIDVLLSNKFTKAYYAESLLDLNKNLVPYLDNYDSHIRLFVNPLTFNKARSSGILLSEDSFKFKIKKHPLIRFCFRLSFFNVKKNNILFSLNRTIYYLTKVSKSNLHLIFLSPKKSGFSSYFNGVKGFVFHTVLFNPVLMKGAFSLLTLNSFFFSFIVRLQASFIKLHVTQMRRFKRIFDHTTKILGKRRNPQSSSIKFFFHLN
jgi:hypothetical protein